MLLIYEALHININDVIEAQTDKPTESEGMTSCLGGKLKMAQGIKGVAGTLGQYTVCLSLERMTDLFQKRFCYGR